VVTENVARWQRGAHQGDRLCRPDISRREHFTIQGAKAAGTAPAFRGCVALPAYQDYTAKAKISEAILAASACRTAVSDVYQTGSTAPGANNWGCEQTVTAPSKYVASIATDADGKITVTTAATTSGLPTGAASKTIQLVPLSGSTSTPLTAANVGSAVVGGFKCGPGTATPIETKYLPGSCKG